VGVARAFLREGWRLLVRAMHLAGTRAVFFVCLLLAITTSFGAVRTLWFSFSGALAEGVVVRQLEEWSADWTGPEPGVPGAASIQTAAATRTYRAVVAFTDGGRSYEVLAQLRSTVHLYPLGSKVDVVYPAGEPGRARLRPELPDFWSQAGLLLMATMLGAGTAYAWWKAVRKRAAQRTRARVVNAAS
jgi:hypothetical protein